MARKHTRLHVKARKITATRRALGRFLGIGEATLRFWERIGCLALPKAKGGQYQLGSRHLAALSLALSVRKMHNLHGHEVEELLADILRHVDLAQGKESVFIVLKRDGRKTRVLTMRCEGKPQLEGVEGQDWAVLSIDEFALTIEEKLMRRKDFPMALPIDLDEAVGLTG